MPGPTLNEVRAKGQPPEVLARLNDEHWFGRLYMRKLSPYATVMFARLGWSPNAVTVCFMLAGVAAGVLTAVPGLAAAIGVALLIQLYLLFDCSDGELARYTGRFSATGVYLDRMGHYIAEALLLAKSVDGVYTADPKIDPGAKMYDEITHREALEQGLKVADATAFSLCMDNRMPIIVFNLLTEGNIARAVAGERIGTLVSTPAPDHGARLKSP